jgi:DNA polymerase III subunit delta
MQVRHDQFNAHLQSAPARGGLKSLYTVWGDETLLVQETCDALRQAARAEGYSERQVHTVSGAHFDWSSLVGAAQSMSLFSDRQLIEIRIPSGKPGKEGTTALQAYAQQAHPDTLTLVLLPKLDRQQQQSAWFSALEQAGVTVRVDPVDRKALPSWIAQRLQLQGQHVPEGQAGQRALIFFADRVEGNLLAAYQEIQKLGLLYPAGELSFEQIEQAVLNVARFDVFQLSEAVFSGQVQRSLRMLDGLASEGEAAVLVHWTLTEDIRSLRKIHDALQRGQPLPMALREARVWGAKEKLFEVLVPRLSSDVLSEWLEAAHICDGLIKGLRHPQWPGDPWSALRQWMLMLLQSVKAVAPKQRAASPSEGWALKAVGLNSVG